MPNYRLVHLRLQAQILHPVKWSFSVEQKDSLLILDKGIAITRQNKFRNQRVIITVYVPVGKQIRIDRSVGWGNDVHFDGPWNEGDLNVDVDDEERGWNVNMDYIMKADGLYTLDGQPADNDESRHPGRTKVKIGKNGIEINDDGDRVTIDKNGVNVTESKDGYRYDNRQPLTNALDSLKIKLENEKQRTKDSLQKIKDNIEKQLDKIDGAKENTRNEPEAISQLQSYNLLVI